LERSTGESHLFPGALREAVAKGVEVPRTRQFGSCGSTESISVVVCMREEQFLARVRTHVILMKSGMPRTLATKSYGDTTPGR
jgi:hypothetical protein